MPEYRQMNDQAPAPLPLDLQDQPGHLIRRAHQLAVARFVGAVGPRVTPLQYAILRTLHDRPGIDQVTLAQAVALDNSTTADTAVRLEAKGLISRELLARRQRKLLLTKAGEQLLADVGPALQQMNESLLAGLPPAERDALLGLLRRFIEANSEAGRAGN